ncbi:hypothetical protein [Candidatus Parabeggiatoa sp. HSG14]|uniref:hypothetical protein n=1 Tax=Candidatus Parabeggiatoa sp. HSG14 TaxID=3055593 RepID=UPI0025A7CBE5|nr:hypothetical protein [Thiotrichales bacterium HSG14]
MLQIVIFRQPRGVPKICYNHYKSNNSTLEKLRQCFSKVIPATDARSKIAPLEYVINLIFGFIAHTNSFSLESVRRQMISQTQKKTNN